MSYSYDHFGKSACFNDEQAVVVKALASDYVNLFSDNVMLGIRNEELESRIKELQFIVDSSIAYLDCN